MTTLVCVLYAIPIAVAMVFAAQELRLFVLYLCSRRALGPAPGPCDVRPLPRVTVQLPLYNERHTAERVIDAAAALDYPPELLQIQVLDDSTDDTRALVDRLVALHRAQGVDIQVLRRDGRAGFKAGALAEGLRSATGELIAMFDADFVPPPDFLREIIGSGAFSAPDVGFVQTRWDYTNRDQSWFTSAQARAHDRHFFVQKPTREREGFVTTFNGSGGVWRRAAIEDAGGWAGDTLTEDLDLTFRAAMRGWRGTYLRDVRCQSDLPPDILSFKLQQRRWARGCSQTTRKLAPAILRARGLRHRFDELVLIGAYFVHAAMLLNLLLWPWAVLYVRTQPLLFWGGQIALLASTVIGLGPMFLAARAHRREPLPRLARDLASVTLVLGMGLMVSNTVAALSGLGNRKPVFERTPKNRDDDVRVAYRLGLPPSLVVELAVLAYCAGAIGLLIRSGLAMWCGALVVPALCIASVVVMQVLDARRGRVLAAPTTLLTGAP